MQRAILFFFESLLQSFCKLIRAGCGAYAAAYSFETGDGFRYGHAFCKPGNALGIAGASTDKFYVFDCISIQLKVDFL